MGKTWMLSSYSRNKLRDDEDPFQLIRLSHSCLDRYQETGEIKWLEEARGFLTLELSSPNHPQLKNKEVR